MTTPQDTITMYRMGIAQLALLAAQSVGTQDRTAGGG
jgi:hypothetical protein